MKLTENSNKMATDLPFSLKREKTLMPQDFLHKPKFMTAENAAYITEDVERKSEYMEENNEEHVTEEVNRSMTSGTEISENEDLMLNKTEDLKEHNEDFKEEDQQPDRKNNTTPTDFSPDSQSVNAIDDDSRSTDDKMRNRGEYDRYTTYTEQGPNPLLELKSMSQHVPIDDSIENLFDNQASNIITPKDLNFHDLMEPLERLASPHHVILERKYPVLPSIGQKVPTIDGSDSQSFRSSTLNQLDYTRDKIEQDADFFADYRLNTSIVKVTPRQNPLPPIKSSNTSSPR
ncbi:hypothetical protein CHS0354_015801 [Potamilus streckersoni]|uniref:Uncharacterized protein n=1 Tax=Potamilus streckersoni TaxID=2493646 RepID=A0AAE0VT94_9BIVA|nr:hypothetical protein CHS0354_015801 [Potamilus streckersoni]